MSYRFGDTFKIVNKRSDNFMSVVCECGWRKYYGLFNRDRPLYFYLQDMREHNINDHGSETCWSQV